MVVKVWRCFKIGSPQNGMNIIDSCGTKTLIHAKYVAFVWVSNGKTTLEDFIRKRRCPNGVIVTRRKSLQGVPYLRPMAPLMLFCGSFGWIVEGMIKMLLGTIVSSQSFGILTYHKCRIYAHINTHHPDPSFQKYWNALVNNFSNNLNSI